MQLSQDTMSSILQPSPLDKTGLPMAQPIVRASSLGHSYASSSGDKPIYESRPRVSSTTDRGPAHGLESSTSFDSPTASSLDKRNENPVAINLNKMMGQAPQPLDSGRRSRSARRGSQSQPLAPPHQNQPQPSHVFPTPPVQIYQHGSTSTLPDSLPFPGSPPVYQTMPPLRQRGSFVGPQYTMSHHQQPSMTHSPPQFAYPRPPGIPGPEANLPHMTYSSASIVPMYAYGSETNSTQQPFTASTPPLYAHHPANPSPPAHTPLSPMQSPSSHPGRPSYQPGYSPVRYSTPTQYVYATPPSYPSSPSMYPSQYGRPPYPQSYSDQDDGTWWYLPNMPPSYDGVQRPYQNIYGMNYHSAGPQDVERLGSSQHPNLPLPQSPSSQQRASSQYGQIHIDQAAHSGAAPSLSRTSQPPLAAAFPTPDPVLPAVPDAERHPSTRRPYHPNPPENRSEWVMWVGNVPADATHDELWRFFNQPLPQPNPSEATAGTGDISGVSGVSGVSSIFLISRTNCAFVNFTSEQHLNAGFARFDGQTLRPQDPRSPRLVCRVRKESDDLRAGVGGQRGMGLHTQWVKDQKQKGREVQGQRQREPDDLVESASRLQGLSLVDDETQSLHGGRRATEHSNSSGSFASTSSGMLTQYFPQRYFILKSLTQYDLDLSVVRGLWATQKHNEGILQQAFRTSKDVYLIFGVNKSGEFYGYARMTGPISSGEQRVPWASPSDPSSSTSPQFPSIAPGHSYRSPNPQQEGGDTHRIFPLDERRFAEDSPLPVSSSQDLRPGLPTPAMTGHIVSAPAELRDPHHKLTGGGTPSANFSLDVRQAVPPPKEFVLDSLAPARALRDKSATESATRYTTARREQSEPLLEPSTALRTVQEEDEKRNAPPPTVDGPGDDKPDLEVWGEPFRVEWVKTNRLPFHRTRHLRNPWNHGREVKVSRDGTELEPSVGKALLEEWERPPSPSATPAPSRSGHQRRPQRPPLQHAIP